MTGVQTCALPIWRGWAGFSADRVLDDLEHLVNDHGVNAVDFADTNFFVKRRRVRAICKGIIQRGLDLEWAEIGRASCRERV